VIKEIVVVVMFAMVTTTAAAVPIGRQDGATARALFRRRSLPICGSARNGARIDRIPVESVLLFVPPPLRFPHFAAVSLDAGKLDK